MGREATCTCHWKGNVAEAKVLLESRELILRGAIKAKISRADIASVTVKKDVLQLRIGTDTMVLELGDIAAQRWGKAISTAPPTLASKLGLGPESLAYVVGKVDDPQLAEALKGRVAKSTKEARMIVTVLKSDADLASALKVGKTAPDLYLWCVYQKGKMASPGDGAVRTFLRKNGYVDSKSCAVSDELTATRYGTK